MAKYCDINHVILPYDQHTIAREDNPCLQMARGMLNYADFADDEKIDCIPSMAAAT